MKKIKGLIARCTARLKSRKGESIGEVLAALLISALALTMLAAMIASASRMVEESSQNLNAYYQAQNGLAAPSGTPADTGTATLTGEEYSVQWDVEYYVGSDSTAAYQLHS